MAEQQGNEIDPVHKDCVPRIIFESSHGKLLETEQRLREVEGHGLRRGHLADLEVVEALLRSDPRQRASGYDASPRRMAEAVRAIIDDRDLHNPDSATALLPLEERSLYRKLSSSSPTEGT